MLSLLVSSLGLSCYASGWRDSSVAGATNKCPATTKARSEWDGHMCSGSNGVCDEANCCQANCWLSGWRDAGDTNTGGTKQCPATTKARGSMDGHMCSGSKGVCDEADCCQANCWLSGWRNAGDTSGTQQCPATTEARSVTDGAPPGAKLRGGSGV